MDDKKGAEFEICRNERQAKLNSSYEMNMVVFEVALIGNPLTLDVIRSCYRLKILALFIVFPYPAKDKL